MRTTQTSTLLLLAFAAACSSEPTGPGTDSPSATLNLDVATAAADATAEDVDVMAGMSGRVGYIDFGAALLGPPEGPGNTNGCGFGGGRFNCPPNNANGLTITRSIAFFDEGGEPQESYDEELTDSVDVEMTLEGVVTRGPWTSDVFRTRHLGFTGLLGEETTRTVNGEGEEEVSRSGQPGNSPARSYELVGTFTIEDVVMPVRAEGVDPWPLSGTITREYTVVRNGGDPVTRLVIITFDGTATPPATVNGEPFEIDLHNRRALRP